VVAVVVAAVATAAVAAVAAAAVVDAAADPRCARTNEKYSQTSVPPFVRAGTPHAGRTQLTAASQPIESKATRTGLHQAVRELFGGKMESETEANPADDADGSRIIIKWSKQGSSTRGGPSGRGELTFSEYVMGYPDSATGGRGRGRGDARGRGERAPRGTYPPFIHFTLQKTNRDTQDALGHLARTMHVNVKDLSVAGTKDKRGVTVQRVSLWRGNKSVEDVWRLVHGSNSRRDALKERGERGIRVADFNYRKARLELGMLKGNAFVITLRCGQFCVLAPRLTCSQQRSGGLDGDPRACHEHHQAQGLHQLLWSGQSDVYACNALPVTREQACSDSGPRPSQRILSVLPS
jgi:hypothetical protein